MSDHSEQSESGLIERHHFCRFFYAALSHDDETAVGSIDFKTATETPTQEEADSAMRYIRERLRIVYPQSRSDTARIVRSVHLGFLTDAEHNETPKSDLSWVSHPLQKPKPQEEYGVFGIPLAYCVLFIVGAAIVSLILILIFKRG